MYTDLFGARGTGEFYDDIIISAPVEKTQISNQIPNALYPNVIARLGAKKSDYSK
jgi:hypothetical protein